MTNTTTLTDHAGLAGRVDPVVQSAPAAGDGVPGVVAGVTTRDGDAYLGASGVRDLSTDEPMTEDTVFLMFSTTKAVTGTAALQLYESGDLDLQAPASEYAPYLGEVQVLEGFDGSGEPIFRAPNRPVTTHDLLTHTAGFAYDFFNENYLRMATDHGQPSITASTMRALKTPLLFDPGTDWEYGSNLDWVGQVVEGITGKRLGEVFDERIFAPLGVTSMTFAADEDALSRKATVHQRGEDGSLTPTDFWMPNPPEVDCGGHGLAGTVGDYLKFIRMWLNDGASDSGEQVLKPSTVEFATQNHLGDMKIKGFTGVIPALSNDAEFFPGQPKSWSYSFMVNDEDAPTGRPAGAQGWAGLGNQYFWIDRENGLGGYWATEILPFGDAHSFGSYLDFESAAYGTN